MDHDNQPPPETPPLDAPPAGSPFRPEPEQPRLGIVHLLLWTACVAVYFSSTRPFFYDDAWWPRIAVAWFGHAIGSGTALGGLLLLAARRYRRLPFPSAPGELLLVLLGVAAGVGLVMQWLLNLTVALGRPDPGWVVSTASFVMVQLMPLVFAVFYLLGAMRTSVLRWRLCFVALFAQNAYGALIRVAHAVLLTPLHSMIPFYQVELGLLLLPGAVLALVALRDVLQRVRYRWTHWLGVAITLWNTALLLLQVAYSWLARLLL